MQTPERDHRGDRGDFSESITTERPHPPLPLLLRLRESGMNSIEQRDPDGFKIPSAIPQDILLIQNLVEGNLPEGSPSSRTDVPSATRAAKTEEDDTDSVTSSSSENLLDEGGDVDMLKGDATVKKERTDKGADSEEEVEAGLLGGGQDGEPMTM